MSPFRLRLALLMVLSLPNMGNAQVFLFRTPPPEVTATNADWQIANEPVIFGGTLYYPTRGTVFFDGQIMAQIGVYRGVPIYADMTREPFSLVLVPVARGEMRVYERRRERELVGTVGLQPPSFPIQRDGEISVRAARPGVQTPLPPPQAAVGTAGTEAMRAQEPPCPPSPVGTVGTILPERAPPVATLPARTPPRAAFESIPGPTRNAGVWIEFMGERWYSAGPAIPYDANRFTPIGHYRGFPAYRDRTDPTDTIYVRTVPDGPVAPYSKR